MAQRTRHGLQAAVVVVTAGFAITVSTDARANLGTWLNTDKKGKIVLSECGEDSLCGKIVWLKEATDEKGQPWRDILNPDPSLRGRQVVGIDVLMNTKKIGPNTWQGQIYDPEVGKVYYLKHLKLGENQVEIRGCLSSGWPCRTKYWTRAEPASAPAPAAQVAVQQAARPSPPPPPAAVAPKTVTPAPVPPPAQARPQAQPPQPAQPQQQARAPVQPQQPVQPRPQARPPAPPRPATAPPPAPSATAAVSSTGGYLVQVAARQSQNEALQAFNALQRRYPQLLGGVRPEVLRADLGQRGVWYRVGIGPMAQQSAAVNFCQRLKSAGADCLIRRR